MRNVWKNGAEIVVELRKHHKHFAQFHKSSSVFRENCAKNTKGFDTFAGLCKGTKNARDFCNNSAKIPASKKFLYRVSTATTYWDKRNAKIASNTHLVSYKLTSQFCGGWLRITGTSFWATKLWNEDISQKISSSFLVRSVFTSVLTERTYLSCARVDTKTHHIQGGEKVTEQDWFS